MNDKNLIQTKQKEKREGKLDKILVVVALQYASIGNTSGIAAFPKFNNQTSCDKI
jgi:hypothetical protein